MTATATLPVAYAGPNPGDAVNRLLDGFFDP